MALTSRTVVLSAVLLLMAMTAWGDGSMPAEPFAVYSADVSPIGVDPVENVCSRWGLDQVVWTEVGRANTPFIRAASGLIGDYVYCFGEQSSNVGQAYNITTRQWEASTPPLLGNCNWCGVVAEGYLYIGGRYDGSYHNEIQRFTPTGAGPTGTWELMAPYPQALCAVTADWDGGSYIYAAGGSSTYPVAYRYDIAANIWEPIASMPTPMRYAGGAFCQGKFYVMGGTQSGMAITNYEYDPATNTWATRANLPVEVYFGLFSFTYNQTYVLSIGGGGGYGGWPATNAVQLYNPADDTWVQENTLPLTLGCNTGIWIGGAGEVVSAGGYDAVNYYAETYWGINFPGGIPPGILEGHVYEEMVPHEAVEGAEVSVLYFTETTDSTGFYRLDRVPEGTNEVTVTAFGYNTVRERVVIVADSTTVMDFYLTQPLIAVDVSSLELALQPGVPHDEVFHITNNGNGPLEFEISIPGGGVDDPWVWPTPDHGTVHPGVTEAITLSFLMPDSAQTGDYYNATVIIDNNSITPEVSIPVEVVIFITYANPGSVEPLPTEYALMQNYPNPFNASTAVRYDVPVAGVVGLMVYDVLGRQVGVLVDGEESAGRHQVMWNAADLPSGVYFVKMEAGEFVQTRKVVLLK